MELLKNCLKSFNIPDLTDIIGKNVVSGLSVYDIPITKSTLVDIVINDKGYSVLSNLKLRQKIIDKNQHIFENFSKEEKNRISRLNWNNLEDRIKLIESFGGEVVNQDAELSKRELHSNVSFKGENLFPYQNWMRNKILNFLISKNNNTLIHMPTGSGKTKTSITSIIDYIRHKSPENVTVVWLAHSDELCEQAIQSFMKLWERIGISDCNVWRMWGGFRELNYEGTGINFIVTSFQTAYKWMISSKNEVFLSFIKIKEKCDLLLIDEAHMSTAETYQQVISNIASFNTKRIGLTATPGRHHINANTDATRELSDFYDNKNLNMTDNEGKISNNPIAFLQKEGILSTIKTETILGSNINLTEHLSNDIKQNLEIPSSILEKISLDQQRFLNVANSVFTYAKIQNKQTLVFCPSKDNAVLLSTFLNNKGCHSSSITSDLSMIERREKINDFLEGKIRVITNFNVLTTGFDAPNIEVVIIARPTFSVVLYSQMIGRGLRGPKVGGTKSVTLVNVEDNFNNLPDVHNAFTFFNEYYD